MTEERDLLPQGMHYNPVTVTEAIGTMALGLMALILLLALLRAQGRNRKLLSQLHRARQEACDT
jgi:hypothetical protein